MRILTFASLFPNRVNPDFGIFIFHRTSHLVRREGDTVQVVALLVYLLVQTPFDSFKQVRSVFRR